MTRPHKVGDYVEWKDFFGKNVERGNIESVNYESGLMCIWTGTFPNSGGGCSVSVTASRVGSRWLIYRPYQGYRERKRRVPPTQRHMS